MNNKYRVFMKYGRWAIWLLLAISFVTAAASSLLAPEQRGDEYFYLQELARFQRDGLWKSYADGISHLHVVLANLLAAVTGSALMGGKLLSILLLPLALLACIGIVKNLKLSSEIELLTITTLAFVLCVSKSGRLFFGFYNDSLMVTLALAALYFMQKYCASVQIKHLIIAAVFTGMMFWVRTFSILIYGGMLAFVLALFIFHQPRARNLLRSVMFFVLVAATALVVQIPSIRDNGRLSFESKGSRSTNEGHWLNRLYRPGGGSIFAYPGVSQDLVAQYKQEHGENSIPGTLSERIARDPKFMVDNFASNLAVRVSYILLVSIGMYFLLFLDALRRPRWMFRDLRNAPALLHFLIVASVSLGLAIIIFNYIEHRWMLLAVLSAAIVAAMHLDKRVHGKWRFWAQVLQWLFVLMAGSANLIGSLV